MSLEELQRSMMESMTSMSASFEIERQDFQDKITKLQNDLKAKQKEAEELKDLLSKLKSSNSKVNDIMKQLKERDEAEAFLQEDLKKKSEQISDLTNKNKLLLSEIDTLKFEVKKYEKYEIDFNNEKNKNKEQENQINALKTQCYLLEKQKDESNSLNEKLKKDNSEKEIMINNLNDEIKKVKANNDGLLKYVKDFKENEEKKKIEEEKLKQEKEKLEKEKLEEENKKKQLEEELRKKSEQENKKNKNEMNETEKNKFLTDILCEFLLKLNNSQYLISVFDLVNKCLKNFDELNFFSKLSINYNDSNLINNILFYFFTNIRAYILLTGKDATLNNFLSQKTFKYSELEKDDIDLLKKIRTVKLGENNNMLDIYKKKKELYFKKVTLTFDLLKTKILNEEGKENEKETEKEEMPELLKLNKPPTEINLNFNLVKNSKLSSLVSFQANNIFSKLEKINIETTDIRLDFLYSILSNCPQSLKSLKILLNGENNEKNNAIFNEVSSMLFSYLKNLNEFSFNNVSLSNKYLPDIVQAIKNVPLQKLTLNNCFSAKEDIAIFNSYFSGTNDLIEIDLSNHNFSFVNLLNNSLLNYSLSKKLISINFNNCCLSDDDVKAISDYICENVNLKNCYINNNPLTQKGCFQIGYAIEKTTSLEKLEIKNCDINNETIMLILNAKGSKTLKYIDISNNNIGDIGLISISTFIKSAPKLEIFLLQEVGGTDMGFIPIISSVKESASFKNMKFEKNKITKESVNAIKKDEEEFKKKGIVFNLDNISGASESESVKFS